MQKEKSSHWFFSPFVCLFLQMTPPLIGYMRAPPGRSAVRTPSTRRSSWRRSSSLTCTSRGTEDTRWRARWTWRSARWRSGSRTAGWKWRNRARTNQRTSAPARTHPHTPTHTYTHNSAHLTDQSCYWSATEGRTRPCWEIVMKEEDKDNLKDSWRFLWIFPYSI